MPHDLDPPDNFEIIVQFDEDAGTEFLEASAKRGATEEAQPRSLQHVAEKSKAAIQAAMATIQEMALQTDSMRKEIPGVSQPQAIRVKFGVQLDFEVGALLAKSNVGATMAVELEWTQPPDNVFRLETDAKNLTTLNAAVNTEQSVDGPSLEEVPEVLETAIDDQTEHPRSQGAGQQFALLIAVDHYAKNRLPDGSRYPSLGGCVRDIGHVEAFLTSHLNIPPQNIRKLTATNSGNALPTEPEDQWPTYENMVDQFKRLTEQAQPGDFVYIHYSGHGGRAKTIYPDLKDEHAFDETLVPTNIGDPNARYLRDVELGYLLKAMVKKGLIVTIVLDCCHSAGATRGPGVAMARGIASIDTGNRSTESLVAGLEDLAAAWTTTDSNQTRSVKVNPSWFLAPQGYTLLAACRSNESAFEYAFDGKERNGALTYWLLDTLRQADPKTTYKTLFDRVLAKIHSQFSAQTPQLLGEGNRTIFEANEFASEFAITVMKVTNQGRQFRLNAGEAHGLRSGTQLAIYPYGTHHFKEDLRLALAEVARVNDVSAEAKVTEQLRDDLIEQGAQAMVISAADIRLQRSVFLHDIDKIDPALDRQLSAELTANGKGFVKLFEPGEQMDFLVSINDHHTYEICDSGGVPLPNIQPALKVSQGNAMAQLVERLIHLAKYRNVQMLDSPQSAIRQSLNVELSDSAGNTASSLLFHYGESGKLNVTNTQAPNPANPNDPGRILNICILALESDWGITQAYPDPGSGAFEPLDPGQSLDLDVEALLPDGYTEGTDTLKIFATRATTDFRHLMLPALDIPDARTATRNAIADPLEQLLASLTDKEAKTRAVRISSTSGNAAWTVAQVEMHIAR